MIIVADSSPLIVLVNIRQIDVLPLLFGRIVVPPSVALEIVKPERPQLVRDFFLARPAWLDVKHPSGVQQIPLLHAGETEAIALAIELKADLLLIDERNGYREAIVRKINAVGTIYVLERAAAQGLLNLADAFDRLKKSDFWISSKFLDERLKLFEDQQKKRGAP